MAYSSGGWGFAHRRRRADERSAADTGVLLPLGRNGVRAARGVVFAGGMGVSMCGPSSLPAPRRCDA
jgi:hypothetical protein